MKIRATKMFTKEIKKQLKNYLKSDENYCIENIEYYEAAPYMVTPFCEYDCDETFDDFGNLKYKSILITYKSEMYAHPTILTTKDLQKIAKNCEKLTIDEYCKNMLNYILI